MPQLSRFNTYSTFKITPAYFTDQVEVIQKLRPQMPTATDLKEACDAIFRLQMTYGLDPAQMAEGLLNGKQYE